MAFSFDYLVTNLPEYPYEAGLMQVPGEGGFISVSTRPLFKMSICTYTLKRGVFDVPKTAGVDKFSLLSYCRFQEGFYLGEYSTLLQSEYMYLHIELQPFSTRQTPPKLTMFTDFRSFHAAGTRRRVDSILVSTHPFYEMNNVLTCQVATFSTSDMPNTAEINRRVLDNLDVLCCRVPGGGTNDLGELSAFCKMKLCTDISNSSLFFTRQTPPK
jgi:hypothetical protein